MTVGERAAKAHYADGHEKSCSPACAVEISFIVGAMQQIIEEAAKIAEASVLDHDSNGCPACLGDSIADAIRLLKEGS